MLSYVQALGHDVSLSHCGLVQYVGTPDFGDDLTLESQL